MENENMEQDENILTLTDETDRIWTLNIWIALPTRGRNIWC